MCEVPGSSLPFSFQRLAPGPVGDALQHEDLSLRPSKDRVSVEYSASVHVSSPFGCQANRSAADRQAASTEGRNLGSARTFGYVHNWFLLGQAKRAGGVVISRGCEAESKDGSVSSSEFDIQSLIATEADAYFMRNDLKMQRLDAEFSAIKAICADAEIDRVLEIGCLDGRRLHRISHELGCRVTGIDASQRAVSAASSRYPQMDVRQGVVPYALEGMQSEQSFDVVIVGFFLYLLPRSLLFRAVSAIDAILTNPGYVILSDFFSPSPITRRYAHDPRLTTYKMDYAQGWTWNPQYSLISRMIISDDGSNAPSSAASTDCRVVDVLVKKPAIDAYCAFEAMH
jgi:hypothetical protein